MRWGDFDLSKLILRWDNNQPEVGCKSRKENEFRKEKDVNRVPAQGAVGSLTERWLFKVVKNTYESRAYHDGR